MRVYIKLSKNTKQIPFNYQPMLTGVVNKWIGSDNTEHGRSSLFSFSWLQNTKANNNGISISDKSYFFISSFEINFLKEVIKGIIDSPDALYGTRVLDIQIKNTPDFSNCERFFLSSPILLKKRIGDKIKHMTYLDSEFENMITENFKKKLRYAKIIDKNVYITIDREYPFSQTKLVDYNGIKNKTSLVPIIIKGNPEQIKFAWLVGLGNSTGIGFGSLK